MNGHNNQPGEIGMNASALPVPLSGKFAQFGGAIATHVRFESPLFSHTLFGVYLGLIAWAGPYLREPRLRPLVPLRS
jgi:hypothetical protein